MLLSTVCNSLWMWWLLLCFWIITVNPTLIACYDLRDRNWVLVSLLSLLKTHVYVPLLLIICQRAREQTSLQCGMCSNFLLRSPGKLHNWSQWCMWAHGSFSDDLHGWVLTFFQHSLLFCWCLVALNVHHLQLPLKRPWNMNAIQKPLSSLKNVLQKPY
jgi:hypothetical protein